MKTSLTTYLALVTLTCAACATDASTDSTTGDDSPSDSGDDGDDGGEMPDDGKADDPAAPTGPIGPGAGATIVFSSQVQKGGFFELSDGRLFSAFRTSTEQLTYGRTQENFEYALVAPDAENADGATILRTAGACVDDDTNTNCQRGLLEPRTQKGITLATADNHLLIMGVGYANAKKHHQLQIMDPMTGMSQVLADFTDFQWTGDIRPSKRISRLPTGELLVSISGGYDVGQKTFILDDTGAVLEQFDGFIVGTRDSSRELAVLRHPDIFTHEYVWRNRETGTTSPAGDVVYTSNNPSPSYDRPVVTADGGLVLVPYDSGEYRRIIRFAPDGSQISDSMVAAGRKIKGVSPNGDAVMTGSGPAGWTVYLVAADGTERTLYDRSTLDTDSTWDVTWGGLQPRLDSIEEPLFDAAGNFYMSFVIENNYSHDSFIVGFDAAGEKQFGLAVGEAWLPSTPCVAHSVLPSGRLAVSCDTAVNNDLYLIGD